MDVLLSGTALLLTSPALLLTWLAIRLEDGPPVLFRQQRPGKDGNPFTIYKFRSMAKDTAALPSAQLVAPTITRTGRVIRRLNIDELPQLLNIVRGDMSIVGPRPPLHSQERLLALRRDGGALRCRPGLTGLAQVSAYDGMSDEVKAGYDNDYARGVSLRLDVVIVLRTVVYLFKRPPVY